MNPRPKVPRRFTAEFKAAAVQRLREELVQGRSQSEVAKALGVSMSVLARWREVAEQQEAVGGAAPGESLGAEVRRLRREVETLRQERDFAKKAAAYFAKELR